MLALKTLSRPSKKCLFMMFIASAAIFMPYQPIDHQYLALCSTHSLLSLAYSIIPDSTRPTLSADYRAFETIIKMNPIGGDDPNIQPEVMIKHLRSNPGINIIVPKPAQCQITHELFEHDGHFVNTYWIDNYPHEFQRENDRLLIYFHGGGYIMGDIHSMSFSSTNEQFFHLLYSLQVIVEWNVIFPNDSI